VSLEFHKVLGSSIPAVGAAEPRAASLARISGTCPMARKQGSVGHGWGRTEGPEGHQGSQVAGEV
jgi:hypothetical protein